MGFKFSSAPNMQSFRLSNFLGVDLTNSESEVSIQRSPDMVNLIKNKGGDLEKRSGMTTFDSYYTDNTKGKFNNNQIRYMTTITTRSSSGTDYEHLIVQETSQGSSTVIWIKSSLNEWYGTGLAASTSGVSDDRIIVIPLDNIGKYSLITGGRLTKPYLLTIDLSLPYPSCYAFTDLSSTVLSNYDSLFYTPTTAIGRSPSGLVSTMYEQVNLLSIKKRNEFLADGTSAKFVTDTTGLVSESTKVWVKVAGVWVLKTLTTHYTVSTDGVTFTAGNIPAVPTIAGEDNVRIEFVNSTTNLNTILRMTAAGTFGFNGQNDYMFFGGYEKTNTISNKREYFGKRELPLYIGELNYTDYASTIVGYSNIGSNHAIHCKINGKEPTIYLRSASLDAAGEVIFPTSSGFSGVGVISGETIAAFRNSPVWLSEYGVAALVSNDISNRSSIEYRSYYVPLNNVTVLYGGFKPTGFVYDDKYYLSYNNLEMLVADARYINQEIDASSTNQYEWFRIVFMGIELSVYSHVVWNGKMIFGTNQGMIMFRDDNDANRYYDDIGYRVYDQYVETTAFVKNNVWEYLGGATGTYTAGQVVYGDVSKKVYVAKKNVIVGIYLNDTEYWQEYTPSVKTTYSSSTRYYFGNGVGYGGKYYVCVMSCQNILPTNTTYWKEATLTALSNNLIDVGDGFMDYSLLPTMIWSVKCPVVAYWTTPVMNMGDPSIKKTLKNLWVRVQKYANMGVKIFYSTDGTNAKYSEALSFTGVFQRYELSNNDDPLVIPVNRQERKFMSIQFKILSDDQYPFSILEIVGKYTINSQFKG